MKLARWHPSSSQRQSISATARLFLRWRRSATGLALALVGGVGAASAITRGKQLPDVSGARSSTRGLIAPPPLRAITAVWVTTMKAPNAERAGTITQALIALTATAFPATVQIRGEGINGSIRQSSIGRRINIFGYRRRRSIRCSWLRRCSISLRWRSIFACIGRVAQPTDNCYRNTSYSARHYTETSCREYNTNAYASEVPREVCAVWILSRGRSDRKSVVYGQ